MDVTQSDCKTETKGHTWENKKPNLYKLGKLAGIVLVVFRAVTRTSGGKIGRFSEMKSVYRIHFMCIVMNS